MELFYRIEAAHSGGYGITLFIILHAGIFVVLVRQLLPVAAFSQLGHNGVGFFIDVREGFVCGIGDCLVGSQQGLISFIQFLFGSGQIRFGLGFLFIGDALGIQSLLNGIDLVLRGRPGGIGIRQLCVGIFDEIRAVLFLPFGCLLCSCLGIVLSLKVLFVIRRVTGSVSLLSGAGSSSSGLLVLMRTALSLGQTLPWITN
jgi:hypothetical protein